MKEYDEDGIFKGVIKVLEETKHLHSLEISEYAAIAALASAIAHSNRIIRIVFYEEVAKVARMLNDKQGEQHKEIGAILRKYRSIWGDGELDEDICRMLDKEDADPKDTNEDDPKKKVIN